MSRFVYELRPPSVPLDADIRWVLLAAFADAGPGDARPASPERAARLIHQFSLVNQVTARLSAVQLAEALTPALQEQVSAVARGRVIRSLAVVRARELVCRAAAEAGVEIVLLKQAALEVMGLVSPAQRYATDVDVLLRPENVTRFSEHLTQLGFVRETSKKHAHGVVVVRSGDDIGVELHASVIGVRLSGDDSVTDFVMLQERGLISQRDAMSPRVYVPSIALVGAHLVAQGWHLFHFVPNAPSHKSPIRVVVDLGLMGVHRRVELANDIYCLTKHDVPEAEFFGLVQCAGHLANGNFEQLSGQVRTVFNHAMAAILDDKYWYGLMINRQLYTIRQEGMSGWTKRQLGRAILPSFNEIRNLVNSGRARNQLEARLRIPLMMVTSGCRGMWVRLTRGLARVRPD